DACPAGWIPVTLRPKRQIDGVAGDKDVRHVAARGVAFTAEIVAVRHGKIRYRSGKDRGIEDRRSGVNQTRVREADQVGDAVRESLFQAGFDRMIVGAAGVVAKETYGGETWKGFEKLRQGNGGIADR